MSGTRLAAAARELVGVPFRLNGREPATGLDCLGVLAASLAALGRSAPLPARTTLRRRGAIDADAAAAALGLVAAPGPVAEGDVLLVRCAPTQLHVLVATGADRFVHAHAGLRRVVIGPRDPAWPIVGHWRLASST